MHRRPYINSSLEDLEKEFERSKTDLTTLEWISYELSNRSSESETGLKRRVDYQINRIKEPRSSNPTQASSIANSHRKDQSAGAVKAAKQSHSEHYEGSIAETLNQIRQRLLDLTRRNALLNYRHPSKRSLRVIDEMPDQLFNELVSDNAFVFAPLPRVPRPEEKMTANIRVFLEKQKDPRRPPTAEWAKLHGLNSSFDLPAPGSDDRRHKDRSIQTTLYPAELEQRLKLMAQLARTAIEESGANILYLAFGFLEWSEREDSEETSLAPLLLVPVALKKRKGLDRDTRREQFSVEYSGEDLQANLSLREKLLKDFSLKLPELDDDDTPETYFKKCRQLLRHQPTWSIRRYVTLGFFQFGKLLMYLDLDPNRWSAGKSIEDHDLVKTILGAEEPETLESDGIPNIDDLPLDAPEVQLVEQADSSQHAAIIDSARGRTMVIEGPPGTGKSQTITNIIGVALARQQSVLFVSEKLAALEVVRKRLESAGLGQYCLELHSHKTQKRKFLADIERRLKTRSTAPSESDVAHQIEHYQNVRKDLSEYLRLVNQRLPEFDFNYQQLFCEAAWLRERLAVGNIHLNPDLLSAKPTSGTLQQAKLGCAELNNVRDSLRNEFGSLDKHPWYGLQMRRGDFDLAEVVSTLTNWSECLEELLARASVATYLTELNAFSRYSELRQVAILAESIDDNLCSRFNVGIAIQAPKALEALIKLVKWEEKCRGSYQEATEVWKFVDLSPVNTWREVSPRATRLKLKALDLSTHSMSSLARAQDCLNRLNAQVEAVIEGIQQVARSLGCRIPADKTMLVVVKEILRLASERPRNALQCRSVIFENVKELDRLKQLVVERHALIEKRAKLSLQFDLTKCSDVEHLKAIKSVLDKTRLFSIFDSEWRSANEQYQLLRLKRSRFRSANRKLLDLNKLENFQSSLGNFNRNINYARILGSEFKGLDTPAEDVFEVCTWNRAVQASLGEYYSPQNDLAHELMRLSETSLEELDAFFRSPLLHSITYATEALNELSDLEPKIINYLFQDGWNELPRISESLAATIAEVLAMLHERLHENQEETPVSEHMTLLKSLVDKLEAPGRAALHEKLVKSESAEVWDEKQLAEANRLIKLLAKIKEQPAGSQVRHCLSALESNKGLRSHLRSIHGSFVSCDAARDLVERVFKIDDIRFLNCHWPEVMWGQLAERVKSCEVSESGATLWSRLAAVIDHMVEVDSGFEQLRPVAFSAEVPDNIVDILGRSCVLSRLASDAIKAQSRFSDFDTARHEQLLFDFKKADDELHRLARLKIAAIANRRRPPEGTSGRLVRDLSEMHLLRREITKQRRHLPIRKVMRRAGAALKALKPCFMMGPLSVAQYLEPNGVTFDIAVMDEASQMRPEDSLGVIARCKQLIVVGDPKQLPPTSFFDRLSDDASLDEDEELTFGAQRSILDISIPVLAPTRTLTWHYRSLHESLIAFSNHSFYNNELLLFPAARRGAEHLGLRYRQVDGVYSNRTNEVEAQELVRGVVREIRSGRGRSVGIAAVNAQQAQVIRDEWDRVTKQLPDLQELLYEEEDGLETLFIKNLENVQGDERDVIFISLTYGKDKNGNFYQRFGPINRDDGWRRLNVLFTRARQQMVVYSSMSSSMVTPTSDSKRGVTALKDFLSYCETGIVPEPPSASDRGPGSPFEEDVAAVIRQIGLEAHYQVGVAGFFIDIGVVDPDAPSEYLLGIECDGASYHSSQSVRDRDKIRQEVLENLGWRIHRIWSTDWFKSRQKQIGRLTDELRRVKSEAAISRDARMSADVSDISGEESEAREPPAVEHEPVASDIGSVQSVGGRSDKYLRESLLELKETLEEEFPEANPESCLLSDDIVEILVKTKPISLVEFHKSIPLERRQKIDMTQARVYLSTVLATIEDNI